jgi:hypothetical protein
MLDWIGIQRRQKDFTPSLVEYLAEMKAIGVERE